MNKIMFFLFIGTLFSACEKDQPDPIKHDDPIDLVNNKKAAELIEADSKFGLDLFREVSVMETVPENFMISPVSVAVALGMTYNGANGTTQTAFEETLRFQGYSRYEINAIHQTLIQHILGADPKVVMELANSIWYNEGFDVLQTFIDTNKFYYDAEVASLDFSDPTSKDIINGWCSDKTHGKIKDVLDAIPADAVMYLINAIYFNGIWTYQFDPEKSYTGTFYKEDGTTTDVAYMKMQQDIPCFQNDLFTAVELPYGNEKFSMCFLLPKGNHTINDLIENINADSLKVWTSQFVEKELVVTIPKFKFGYKDLLNDPLTNMGLGIAFGPLADFTGIRSSGGLMISRVIHQSFIDVNEKGTEAAAVTVVEIIETSVNPEMTFFMANHPFIFVLREKSSNALLFIGKVGVPEYGD